MAAFEELGILPEIAKAVDNLEWQLPTDIQAEAIPLILGGGDVLMAAETGSGKTGAFCLPVLQIVYETLYCKKKESNINPDFTNEIKLSLTDRNPSVLLSNDLLSCQSKTSSWAGIRSNKGVTYDPELKNQNKFYYEIFFTRSGLARFGWSLPRANLDLGTDKFGYGYGGTAKKSNDRQFDEYGEEFGDKNDIIGACLDLDKNEISFLKNGKYLGVAFQLNNQYKSQNIYVPTICVKNAQCSVRFNTVPGSENFIPNGFKWIGQRLNFTTQVVQNPNIKKNSDNSDKLIKNPKAIIIEPSRELAEQTLKCITDFKKFLPNPINELLVIGGMNVKDQIVSLKQNVDIIVATPHRLEDLIQNGHISLNNCRFFIIDEIDAFLAQKNMDILLNLYYKIPKMFDDGKRLQIIVCSATLHNFEVKKFAEKFMYFPSWIDLKGVTSVPDTVHHVVLRVDPRKMESWKNPKLKYNTDGVHHNDYFNTSNPNTDTYSEAVKILKADLVIKAINSLKMDQAIIFCRTKLDCDNLEKYLNLNSRNENSPLKYSCACLHSDRNAVERKNNLESFVKRQIKFLICTDVAARGIDVKGVPFVIQVTLPEDKVNYIHRIGRVGRAERMGLAISLVSTVQEKVWYHSCSSRGKNCNNTNFKQNGGCCIYYNELGILSEIEDSLNVVVSEIYENFEIEVNEFDGKVTYGDKKLNKGGFNYENHAEELKSIVNNLSDLESQVQKKFLSLISMKPVNII